MRNKVPDFGAEWERKLQPANRLVDADDRLLVWSREEGGGHAQAKHGQRRN